MDIAVQDSNSSIFYVASASGGLWKTVNGGISFDCVFDYGGSVSMGSIGLSKSDPNVAPVNNQVVTLPRGEMESTSRSTRERPGSTWV
jgi:hypothetical protein